MYMYCMYYRVLSLALHTAFPASIFPIDTLARFVDTRTIVYVRSEDPSDEHYSDLTAMEQELKELRRPDGQPYRLVPLPMAEALYDGADRLPATYANFLIINGAVLVPTYDSHLDAVALSVMQGLFPDREVIGIDCRPLVKQHGSLHYSDRKSVV